MEISNYCKFFRRDVETCGSKANPIVIVGNVCPWADSDKEAIQECPKYQTPHISAISKKYPKYLRD